MNCLSLAFIASALVGFPDAPKDAKGRPDLERIQGKWIAVAAEELGERPSEEAVKRAKITFVFRGTTGVFEKPGHWNEDRISTERQSEKFGFRLRPSLRPKEIDIRSMEEPDAPGEWIKGIYSLEGDTLKICLSYRHGRRPKTFTTDEESSTALVVLKRQKP